MRVRIAGLFVCVVVMAAPILLATENPPTHGETVAREIQPPNLVWMPGIGDGQLVPQLPQVFPMEIEDPMPWAPDEWPESFANATGGNVMIHDTVNGETIEVDPKASRVSMPQQGGAYSGAYPVIDEEPFQTRSFADMLHITNTDASPWRMNVKLLMRFVDDVGSNRWFVCSGSMKDAEVVMTAGHCVYNRDADIDAWASEIWVYPGWDGDGTYASPPVEPFGYGHSTLYTTWTAWVNDGNWDYDQALIEIARPVGMMTGWYGYKWGSDCAWHQSQSYNNASYPSQNCPLSGLHNGHDMYYWWGSVDACPNNQLELWTGGGNCYDTVWGGMSGSGMYYIDTNRYVHATCSTSNRSTWGRYARITEDWVNVMYDTFIPNARGATFDLHALNTNFEPTTITAGNPTTLANFFTTNPTNGTDAGSWYYDIYLSSNNNISASDNQLSRQSYSWTYGAMNSVTVNMIQPTIPYNTPSGTYWLGVVLDPTTDANSSNNDTDTWDATEITVVGVHDLEADYVSAPSGIFAPGQAFSVSYHATNIGGDTSTPVTVEIRASTNTIISTLDTLIGTASHSAVLGEAAINGSTSVSFPSAMSDRNYYIGIRVLTTGDADSGNNTAYDATPLMLFRGMFYDGFESGNMTRWSTTMP